MGKVRYFVKTGFTLIELLIVIAILGILAAAVIIAINPNKRLQEARDATRLTDTSQISGSIAEYYVTHGTYPPDPAISTETEFASDEGPNWIPGLDNLPQDPNQAGIISTLASLFNMKGNERINSERGIKPQVAGTQSVTITSNTSDNFLRFRDSSNPPDYKTCMGGNPVGGIMVGQFRELSTDYYYSDRGYLPFDTSSIPSDSTITSVSLKLTGLVGINFTTRFTLNVRKSDGMPSGCTNAQTVWGGNPPISPLLGTFDTASLPNLYTTFSIPLSDPSTINKEGITYFLLTSNREENNVAPVASDEYMPIQSGDNSNTSYRPELIIEYTTAPPPEVSPPPSPPPKGCKNKKKIYCYLVPLDRKSAILWAVLENEDDERIYSKPTAKCKETPPAETFLNYCINNP